MITKYKQEFSKQMISYSLTQTYIYVCVDITLEYLSISWNGQSK